MARAKKSIFPDEERVKIKIPLSRAENKDVFVAVNGKTVQIKRGEEVEVPKCIVEVLQHKEEMIAEAIAYESGLAGKAEDKELN